MLKADVGDVRENLEGLLVTPAPASPAPIPQWKEVRKKSKEERKSASPKEALAGKRRKVFKDNLSFGKLTIRFSILI